MSKDQVRVVAAAFYKKDHRAGDQIALFRRKVGESSAGAWEFPGGKVELGETDAQALEREMIEELNVSIKVEDYIGSNIHSYPTKTIELHLYICCFQNWDNFELLDHDWWGWFSEEDMQRVNLAAADIPLVSTVFEKLRCIK